MALTQLTDLQPTNIKVTGIATFDQTVGVDGNVIGDNATNISGINSVTATTFYGNGANLSGVTGTTINSNADGRVITGSNTANTLNANGNFTYSNQKVSITGSQKELLGLQSTHSEGPQLSLSDSSGAFAYLGSAKSLFTGGSLTDLGLRTANNISFGINGNEKLRIDSSGRLGIGTTNPDTLLHLTASSSSSCLQRFQTSSYSSYISQIQANNNVSTGAVAGDLHLRGQSGVSMSANNGTATHFRINSSGLVGIGTNNPLNDLEVYKVGAALTATSVVRGEKAVFAIMGDATNTGASETDARLVFSSDGDVSPSKILTSPLANHGFEIALINEEPGSGLRFHDGTANAERFRIQSSGNALFSTNQVKLYNNVDTSNTYFYAENTGGGNAGVRIKNQDGDWQIIANDSLRFRDGDASLDRLTITSSGTVTKPVQPHVFITGITNTGGSGNANSGTATTYGAITYSNGRVTAQVEGNYLITFASISDNGTGRVDGNIRVNGSNIVNLLTSNNGTGYRQRSASIVYHLNVNDYVDWNNDDWYAATNTSTAWRTATVYMLG